jgi:hypothetical protein
MAVSHKVQVFKHLGTTKWSNTYLLAAPDMDTAVAATTDAIIPGEKAFHRDIVTFDSARVSTYAEGDDEFVTIPINDTGDVATSGAQYLPLFNCTRVDISTSTGGRPSRKYYRIPVMEGDQQDGVFVSGYQSAINGFVQDILDGISTAGCTWVDPDSQALDTPSCVGAVQMRQLHRRRRRTPAP